MTITNSTSVGVTFLRLVRNDVTLSAAWVDPVTGEKGNFESAGFRISAAENQMAAWLGDRQRKANLYWAVNPTIKPQNTKPKLTDIARVEFLHVDIDPEPGKPIEEERARILASLRAYHPAPSIIIDSGSGYQGFWKLETPIPIDGDLAKANAAGLYNKKLAADLGGDACHDVSRILRIPGTVNVPDKGKLAKSRVAAPALIIFNDQKKLHPLSAFKPADDSAAGAPGQLSAIQNAPPATKITAEYVVQPVGDFENRVSPTGQLIRAHGGNMKEPADRENLHEHMSAAGIDKSYTSNSELGNAYVCTLVNAGYTPEEIAGDLLVPENPAGKHYRDQKNKIRAIERSIDAALRLKSVAALEARTGFRFPDGYNPDAKPFNTYGNTRAAIDGLGFKCSYDVFGDKMYVENHAVDELSGEVTDHVYTFIQDVIYNRFGFYPSVLHVQNAVIIRARENSLDPVRDHIDGLVWDKTPRIDTWLQDYMGAKDSPYVRAVCRKFQIGLVRRVRDPGCKLDSMLILEGEQGVGKSLQLRDYAGAADLFTDQDILTLDGKGQQELLQGKLICEIAELSGLRRTEVEKVKAFVTRTHDRGRPAYGRCVVDRPRRGVIAGSTNEKRYFRDASGNRRFWPVEVFRYNREAFLRDRDQLLAEAACYEATGESLYLPADVRADASSEQQARMVEDGWADLLAHVDGFKDKSDREFRVSSAHLLTEVLRLPAEKHNDATLKRLGTAMRKLSWEGPKSLRVDEPLQGTNPPKRRKGVFSGYYRSGPPVQLELEVDQ